MQHKLNIDFSKGDGLAPAIIQDAATGQVLMLGYMNDAALSKTLESGLVTFYSRSKERLWTKGETSGHTLQLVDIKADCDKDTLLVRARPDGPVCHTGTDTCWGEQNRQAGFIGHLQHTIQSRKNGDPEQSYTARLLARGINKVAQKVGEEAVELVIEAKDDNEQLFLNEAADLMYHYLVLLTAKGYALEDVLRILEERHR
ncbi:bifunctional phosphoribosyl-AMP cyclohydrolase/phosphoribosyl-ATP diphosphatase HisIE [Phaeodactylibacter luteus]|uniref:Histidine biosynthesis bifunctional protein HisIE n=1 Tax=Phaeodactylibacter luteus TaxID=1564516 RepID=A0A5C6RJL9_9BACT|nr:bifunctional phosphoribosyl-AMP cyclohydrolase/phosphoribosyl-ATP diphosphatase HisIE [Phaeodactylibacter luteus]TXB62531.1 bifunctional phosphoribosyl-AMP cyclohydrolase/phosphoribosyl-ATP diphosphatase HisIE [Phaeodactylibacter luteus]